jgi:hypothetical protein
MKNQLRELTACLNRASLTAALTLGLLSAALPTLAQVDPQLDSANPGRFDNPAEQDSSFGGSNGNDFNLFNLMRNAQLGNTRNPNEVIDEQRQDWDKGTNDFLRQQRERLGNQNPSTPTQPSGK